MSLLLCFFIVIALSLFVCGMHLWMDLVLNSRNKGIKTKAVLGVSCLVIGLTLVLWGII